MNREVFDELSFPLALLFEQFGLGLQQIIIEHLQRNQDIENAEKWYRDRIRDSASIYDEGIELLNYVYRGADEQLRTLISETLNEADKTTANINNPAVADNATTERVAINHQLQINEKYYNRISDTLNTTNATMLDSATGRDSEYRRLLRDVLNDLNNNQLTKQNALVRAIESFSKQGMPAFYDSLGREWSPEAYLRMVVFTESSNAYRESIFAKMEDTLETDLFYISAHRGARPLCEPYQGILCSYSNQRGVVEDINNEKILYIPLTDTSYGEPAGIFGKHLMPN